MTKDEDIIEEGKSGEEDIMNIEDLLEEDIKEAEKAEEAMKGEIKELGKISDELTNLKDALARAQADYQNLIRRVERDREEMGTYLSSNILSKMLPFLDNIERLIAATPEEEKGAALFEGIKSTQASFLKTLEGLGVKQFESIGKEVDANLHDVITQMPGEEGKIIMEFEKGYMIGDKVLRHAKVVIGISES